MVLAVQNLRVQYGARVLFNDLSFTIEDGERIALAGHNGAGKSTLMKCIAGLNEPDSGSIIHSKHCQVGYLPQEGIHVRGRKLVDEAMSAFADLMDIQQRIDALTQDMAGLDPRSAAYSEVLNEIGEQELVLHAHDTARLRPRTESILRGLGFKDRDFDRDSGVFSGGWQMRIALAKLLLREPEVLLLDEPTNHLDLHSLLWLQRYLKNYPGAILMISHDRDFMDELVESVYDIDNEELVEYRGNYTDFLKQRDVRFEQLQAAYRNQQKEIAHIQEFIDRFRSINSKAGQVQSRIKQLEKMKVIQKPVARRKVFKFNFPQPPRSTQKVIELEKVCQSYGDHKVYENLDLLVERGERTVLVGPKATLLKLLAGIIPIDSGKRIPGTTTRIGYFSQARTENLNPENTVLEEIMKCNAEIREEEARSILGSFLFRRLDVEKRVSVLSGGEKSRLSLVKFLVDPPNLLLMDEPTTHLDLLSVEALVQALKHYEGTLVFISHDVHFIRSLAEKTLHVNRGTITTYAGGYDYYLEKSGILDDEKGGITAE